MALSFAHAPHGEYTTHNADRQVVSEISQPALNSESTWEPSRLIRPVYTVLLREHGNLPNTENYAPVTNKRTSHVGTPTTALTNTPAEPPHTHTRYMYSFIYKIYVFLYLEFP